MNAANGELYVLFEFEGGTAFFDDEKTGWGFCLLTTFKPVKPKNDNERPINSRLRKAKLVSRYLKNQ